MHEVYTLANGLRIFLVPIAGIKSVSVGIFVGVGSRYEAHEHAGVSHFIEHMLFKGTAQRPTSRVIAEAIEGIGGLSNAYTDQELTVYYAKVAASQSVKVLNVLTDMVRHSRFDPLDIEREQQVIDEEIDMVYDSPDEWIDILLDQLLWPEHPLGQNIAGTHQTLATIDREVLLNHYHAAYHPHNAIVAISGAFDRTAIIAELEATLGDWQPHARPAYAPAPAVQTAPRWRIEERAIEQAHLCLSVPGLPRAHPDRFALSLLNTILGDGMSSRLFLSVREDRGLAYDIDSSLAFLQDTGALTVYAGVDVYRATEALEAILTELTQLCETPVSEAELHKAREYTKGRLVLSLEDSYSQAAWVAYQAIFDRPFVTPEDIIRQYEAVTPADIQRVAQHLIQPERYNLAAIGPFRNTESLVRLMA